MLREALHDKQALLAEAGLAGSMTTQMCLDPAQIRRWLTEERERGLTCRSTSVCRASSTGPS